jgi:hypothetical protein
MIVLQLPRRQPGSHKHECRISTPRLDNADLQRWADNDWLRFSNTNSCMASRIPSFPLVQVHSQDLCRVRSCCPRTLTSFSAIVSFCIFTYNPARLQPSVQRWKEYVRQEVPNSGITQDLSRTSISDSFVYSSQSSELLQ